MNRWKKYLLYTLGTLCIIIIALLIWVQTAGNIEYEIDRKYRADPQVVYDLYTNMKYWPEWQKGIKATRILRKTDNESIYEVIRLDDEVEIRDTVTIEIVDELMLKVTETNMFYDLIKTVSLERSQDFGTDLHIHYLFTSDTQIQKFLLSLIKSSLKEKSAQELEELKEVISHRSQR